MQSLTVDHVLFPELVESSVVLSNAKGLFSNSLAEYVLLSCLYFAKDVDRWKQQQKDKQWNKFVIKEVSLYYQHE
jgi:phosphoglycerate dehydrogenase-like enzyme